MPIGCRCALSVSAVVSCDSARCPTAVPRSACTTTRRASAFIRLSTGCEDANDADIFLNDLTLQIIALEWRGPFGPQPPPDLGKTHLSHEAPVQLNDAL